MDSFEFEVIILPAGSFENDYNIDKNRCFCNKLKIISARKHIMALNV